MTCRLVKIVHPSPVKTYELPAADTRVPEAAWSLLGAKYNVTVLKSDALSGIAHLDLTGELEGSWSRTSWTVCFTTRRTWSRMPNIFPIHLNP
jgi:hypothetical protein